QRINYQGNQQNKTDRSYHGEADQPVHDKFDISLVGFRLDVPDVVDAVLQADKDGSRTESQHTDGNCSGQKALRIAGNVLNDAVKRFGSIWPGQVRDLAQ